jgi:maltose O-acetyltransferase
MSEWDKMLAGEPYRADDPDIRAELAATASWLARYNSAATGTAADRRRLLAERLGAVGEGTDIRPPFHCDYGFNIRIGRDVFLNVNCVILDVVEVDIGDASQVGPAVQIYAADHPRKPSLRRQGLEFGQCRSAAMYGSGVGPSSCRGSGSVTMLLSARAAW